MDHGKAYPLDEALKLVKETAVAKFDESVDVAVNLGVDAKKSDQTVRGSVVLPAGTGKKVRIAVFAQGDKAKAAQDAGADIVGFDDLAAKVKEGFMEFDVVIATPDAMKVVGQLGQILGPRGLMPNPKVGTVTPDVTTAVKNARAGQVQYRTDKGGIVQCTIGRASFAARAAEDQPARADRGAEQGAAAGHEGHLPEEDQRVEHDGRGCPRRYGEPRAAGAGVTSTRQADGTIAAFEGTHSDGCRRERPRPDHRPRWRAVKDRRGEGLMNGVVGGRGGMCCATAFRPTAEPSADGVPRTGFSWRKVTEFEPAQRIARDRSKEWR